MKPVIYAEKPGVEYTTSRRGEWTIVSVGGREPSETSGWERYETDPMSADDAERACEDLVADYVENDEARKLKVRTVHGYIVCELGNELGETRIYEVELP